jgi:hypothetical protein
MIVAIDDSAGSGSIQVEVADAPHPDVSDVYSGETTRDVREKVIKLARPLFSEAIDLMQSCAVQVRRKMDGFAGADRPDELEIQFAIRLDAKVGAAIAESSGGAQLQVCLRWKGQADG